MNVSFTDFWPDFDPCNNFFSDLLKSIEPSILTTPLSNDTDVLIYSCFGTQHYTANRNKTKKIFYTGESIIPNFNECDYSWSFEFNDHYGKNIRIPLWLLQIDFFDKKGYSNPQYVVPLEWLINHNQNPWYKKSKTKFCVIVNNHLLNQRDVIIEQLSKKKEVDGYGRAFGNNWFYGEEKKLNLISEYRFNICFENKLHSGYYTEKILHAKAAGCIPLYYSDLDISKDFNPKSFINLSNFKSMDEFVDYIFKIEDTPSLLEEIKNETLFKNSTDPINFLNNVKGKIKETLNL